MPDGGGMHIGHVQKWNRAVGRGTLRSRPETDASGLAQGPIQALGRLRHNQENGARRTGASETHRRTSWKN